jgi:phenylacetate-CoA ligase
MFNVDTILRFNGFPVSEARKIINDITKLSDLSEWHNKKKMEIFNFHFNNNKFYNSLITKKYENWDDIPVLTKNDLTGDFKKKIPDGIDLKNSYISKTSGSSGEPMYFVKDKLSHALIWEVIFNHYERIGISKSDFQARFYGIPLNRRGYYFERFKDFLINRYRFIVFDLTDKTMEKWLKKFKNKRFNYAYGYTKTLVEFAKFLTKRGIVLKDVCPTLKACIVTSEVCIKPDCELLERTFGVEVYNEYGASELSVIGFGKLDNWQVSDEILYLEVLDENNNKVEDGNPGRLVATLLFNKATPLIRYDTGDIASIVHVKGRTYITSLQGRLREQALMPSGKKVSGAIFGYVAKEITEMINIKEFNFIQRSKDEFVFNYVADRQINDDEIVKGNKIIEKYLEKGIKVMYNRVEKIKRPPSGKFKYFINEFIN